MTQQQLDYLHDQGKVPDWWYYQQSDKPVWMKWQEQTDKFNRELEERQKKQEQERQEKALEAQVEQEVEEQLETVLDKALGDLFKDFT